MSTKAARNCDCGGDASVRPCYHHDPALAELRRSYSRKGAKATHGTLRNRCQARFGFILTIGSDFTENPNFLV